MKITKRQLRRIIREEKNRLNEARAGEAELKIVYGYIQGAVFDALEENSVDATTADQMAELMVNNPAISKELVMYAERGVNDYIKKLGMTGGTPKPRSV